VQHIGPQGADEPRRLQAAPESPRCNCAGSRERPGGSSRFAASTPESPGDAVAQDGSPATMPPRNCRGGTSKRALDQASVTARAGGGTQRGGSSPESRTRSLELDGAAVVDDAQWRCRGGGPAVLPPHACVRLHRRRGRARGLSQLPEVRGDTLSPRLDARSRCATRDHRWLPGNSATARAPGPVVPARRAAPHRRAPSRPWRRRFGFLGQQQAFSRLQVHAGNRLRSCHHGIPC